MKELVLTFEDTEQLELVIENTYFTKGYMGKKGENVDLLNINTTDTIHSILSGMDYSKVKIKNFKILGTLTCDVVQHNDTVTLRPYSDVCVKEHKKYSFY